jgi:hypothetical protein
MVHSHVCGEVEVPLEALEEVVEEMDMGEVEEEEVEAAVVVEGLEVGDDATGGLLCHLSSPTTCA